MAQTVGPLAELFSQCLTRWLVPRFGESRLVIWLAPAKPNDAEQRLREWDTGVKYGAVSVNEFRRTVLNLEDMPGGDQPPEVAPAGRNGRANYAVR